MSIGLRLTAILLGGWIAVAAGAVPVATAAADDRAAIQALLDDRARALMERDREAFMATLDDPTSTFGRAQRRMFRWIRSVPLTGYRLEARWDKLGDMARPSDLEGFPGAEEVVMPVTEERYRIRGFDESEAVEDVFFTFVKRDGRWGIGTDDGLNDLGIPSARHMWHFGPVEVRREGRFLFITHACRGERECSRVPPELPELARAALQRVDGYWREWNRRVVIAIPATDEQLRRMLQVTFDTRNFVAFAYSTIDTRDDIAYTAPRIVFNNNALDARSSAEVVRILAHELLHVGTRAAAGPFVPVFVEEGFAEHVASDGDPGALDFLTAQATAGGFEARLPEDFEFLIGNTAAIFGQYQKGQAAVDYLIERWGLETFKDFYRDLGSRRRVAGTARYHLSDALRQSTNLGYAGFQRAWASTIAP